MGWKQKREKERLLNTRDKGRDYSHRDAAGYEQRKQMVYEFIEKYKDKFSSLAKAFKEDLPTCRQAGMP